MKILEENDDFVLEYSPFSLSYISFVSWSDKLSVGIFRYGAIHLFRKCVH